MYVKFVKDDKTIEEVSISSEMIPFPTARSWQIYCRIQRV